jgi:hypothetical protein
MLPYRMQTRLLNIGTDIDRVEMVTTDDRGNIPVQYKDCVEVLSKIMAETIPPHRPADPTTDLEPSYTTSYGRIYNLSEFDLKLLKDCILMNQATGLIAWSSSPSSAALLAAIAKDGRLLLCVDSTTLNLGKVNT